MRPPELLVGNESRESRGKELVLAYQKILGGEFYDGEHDGGCDLLLDNPPMPVQVKNSWSNETQRFLAEAIRRKAFIPMLIGDPGLHRKEEIIDSLIKHGCWVGDDVPHKKDLMENIEKVKKMIVASGGSTKRAPKLDHEVHYNN